MKRCFVIQPFDNADFDHRYDDIIAPAITKAGLTPYRVDRDDTINIPIEAIHNNIRDSKICLADVTSDNPNVWYELGYSMQKNKPLILICSEDRKSYPFDIQHLQIIRYKIGSPRHFEDLSKKIVDKISAIVSEEKDIQQIQSSLWINEDNLSTLEQTALIIITKNTIPNSTDLVTDFNIHSDMERHGFNRVGCNIALLKLQKKEMIEYSQTTEGWSGNIYPGYKLTQNGIDWVLENENKINLHANNEKLNIQRPNKIKKI